MCALASAPLWYPPTTIVPIAVSVVVWCIRGSVLTLRCAASAAAGGGNARPAHASPTIAGTAIVVTSPVRNARLLMIRVASWSLASLLSVIFASSFLLDLQTALSAFPDHPALPARPDVIPPNWAQE